MNSIVLPIHIAAGGLALVLGAVAPLVKKGETVQRRVGLIFVYAMLVTGLSAAILRVAKILPEPFTTAPMRTLPILLIFGATFYWLCRVRGRHTLPVVVRYDSRLLTALAE